MNLEQPTTYVFLGLAVAWGAAFYAYWRYVRSLHANSRYRAYDLLFLTLFIGIMLARGVEVFSNFDYYFRVVGGLQFAAVWDLQINYLTLLYAPLLAYQFESFNIERKTKWKQSADMFILFGALVVLLVEVAQIARGLNALWPSNLIIYHALQVTLLGLIVLIVSVRQRLPAIFSRPQVLLIAGTVSLMVVNVLMPVLSANELNATIISLVGLCVICLLPFVTKPQKRVPVRPNPGDFRNL